MKEDKNFTWITEPIGDTFDGIVMEVCDTKCYDYCIMGYCLCVGPVAVKSN